VSLHVTDRATFRPLRTTVALLAAARQLYPDDFAWLPPPYEYETVKMPIDILFGDARLRTLLDGRHELTLDDVDELCSTGTDWLPRTMKQRLYD
jgi:uncharacterized protein YbbC (DUF1343 family)